MHAVLGAQKGHRVLGVETGVERALEIRRYRGLQFRRAGEQFGVATRAVNRGAGELLQQAHRVLSGLLKAGRVQGGEQLGPPGSHDQR